MINFSGDQVTGDLSIKYGEDGFGVPGDAKLVLKTPDVTYGIGESTSLHDVTLPPHNAAIFTWEYTR